MNGISKQTRAISLMIMLSVARGTTETAAQNANTHRSANALHEIYGFVTTDMGYESGQKHPQLFDVVRPTKLASFEDEFGRDGHTYFSVRQTRFGEKAFLET